MWGAIPDRKALKYSGAKSAEVIVRFRSIDSFESDPAFSSSRNTSLSDREREHVNKFRPVRSCFPGPVRVSDILIMPR